MNTRQKAKEFSLKHILQNGDWPTIPVIRETIGDKGSNTTIVEGMKDAKKELTKRLTLAEYPDTPEKVVSAARDLFVLSCGLAAEQFDEQKKSFISENESLQGILSESKKECEDLRLDITENGYLIKQQEEQIHGLSQTGFSLAEKLKESKNKLVSQEDIFNKEIQLKSLECEKLERMVQHENEEARKQIDQALIRYQGLETKSLMRIVEEQTKAELEKSKLNEKIDVFTSNLNDVKSENSGLKSDVKNLGSQITRLESELLVEQRRTEKEIEQKNKLEESLNIIISTLQEKEDALNLKIIELVYEKSDLAGQLKATQQSILDYKVQLKEAKSIEQQLQESILFKNNEIPKGS